MPPATTFVAPVLVVTRSAARPPGTISPEERKTAASISDPVKNRTFPSWDAVRPLVLEPMKIWSVPPPRTLPLQLLMVSVAPAVQLAAELALNRSTLAPAPRSMVDLAANVRVPTVSLWPAVSKLPPPRLMLAALAMRSELPSESVPALIDTIPVKVLLPDSVTFPVPDLVRPPVPLITLLTAMLPAPLNVGTNPPFTILLIRVSVPLSLAMVLAAARVILPSQELLPLMLRKAPPLLTPLPVRERASVPMATPPCNCNEPPL